MGKIAKCFAEWNGQSGMGTATLESDSLRFRGAFRFDCPLPGPSATSAEGILQIDIDPVFRLQLGPAWLSDARWAPWTLVFMALWGVGGGMVIYLAGLKDIPTYLYEAAIIDGASAFTRMRRITLPMLTPVIFFNVVMGVIGAFQYFTQAYILTQGGPEESTTFYALYLFNRAWRYLDMGYASAMAWVLFLIVVVVTSALFRTQSKWVHYGG